jgi:mono/diheme cytochrome c family protein
MNYGLAFLLLTLALCTAPGSSLATQAEAQQSAAADPVLAELGERVFRTYCASCHGLDASGNGPAAHALQVPPADLRRIAARRGGSFPDGEIAMKIDGRFEIVAHGSREMPVWGATFGADIPQSETAESIARGKIAVVVEYLKSIQDLREPQEPAATRQTMAQIFDAMRFLLPLSLDGSRFDDPEQAAGIRAALDVLDRSSSALGGHGAARDASFAHLSRSLAIDARDIRIRYEQGQTREARYLVQTLTETCVACHSRLPAGSAPRSDAFVREAAQLDLALTERAKLAYATRQFDVAGELYETILASQEIAANDIDLNGHLHDYLELEIRVQRNPAHTAEILEVFSKRSDLSPALRADLVLWIASLRALSGRAPTGSPVADATALIGPEDELRDARAQLVELLEASGLLHRALSAGVLDDSQRAEAYYLLGVIETRIGRSYWLSEAEAYLETAIRLAPGQPVAQRAYALLYDFLVSGYSGSGGTHVPPDVHNKLELLRLIADGA